MSGSIAPPSSMAATPTTDIPRTPSPPHVHPQHTYTNGIPGPPRILIPPPTILRVGHDPNSIETSNDLETLISTPAALQDWKYESRREAQQILPWLWLGPLSATKNKEWLALKGITLLIAIRDSMTAKAKLLDGHDHRGNATASAARIASGVEFVTLDLPPTPSAPLISTFMSAAKLIDKNYISTIRPELLNVPDVDYHGLVVAHRSQRTADSLPRPGATLVFCETGNEKSAVVVASYIMQHYGASVVQAVQIVQGRRFSVGFDDAMKFRLVAYEPIWRSWRQVEGARREDGKASGISGRCAATADGTRGSSASKKRSLEEEYGDEEGSNDHSAEVKRIGEHSREGVAPFRDLDDLMDMDDG